MTNTIKSVKRVFQILELFAKTRKPLAARQISNCLDYPISSTHVLLKSMHQLGYADLESDGLSYVPSSHLGTLVEWVEGFHSKRPELLEFMRRLNLATRETVSLSRLAGNEVKTIHARACRQPVGVSVRIGTVAPAGTSLTGLTALSTLAGSSIDVAGMAPLHRLTDVRRQLVQWGTAAMTDAQVPSIGAVCLPVKPWPKTKNPLVVSIVGPSERIMNNRWDIHRSICKLAEPDLIRVCFRLNQP